MKPSPAKPKKCKVCKTPYIPHRPMQTVCGLACSQEIGRRHGQKRIKEQEKAERKADREKRESMKTIPELIAEADTAFGAFIRERDRLAGRPCISSGRPLDWSGNQTDAGHWRSKGAASHLRYNEDNCHAQSKHDNRFLAGNAAEYRIRLIARIGLDRVEALEADNNVHKWTRDELQEIKARYRKKLRELKANR